MLLLCERACLQDKYDDKDGGKYDKYDNEEDDYARHGGKRHGGRGGYGDGPEYAQTSKKAAASPKKAKVKASIQKPASIQSQTAAAAGAAKKAPKFAWVKKP